MEPLDDGELDKLLAEWRAPAVPGRLEQRLRRARRVPWWQWLLTGTVRVPIPVALVVLVAFATALVMAIGHGMKNRASGGEFRPIKQVQIRIIRSNYESNR